MKNFLLLCFILLCEWGLACSGFPKSFCFTHSERPNDLVVKAVIFSTVTNAIDLKVLQVLKGTETRTLITVWDGKDFDCTGNVSMKASGMGSLGDTIIAVLPKIAVVYNSWDVVGDYSRPYHLFYQPVLVLKNDTVHGRINGSARPGTPFWSIWKMSIADFENYWANNKAECSTSVGIGEYSKTMETLIWQNENKVHISIPGTSAQQVSIISIEGALIAKAEVSGKYIFDLEPYAHGIYIACVLDKQGKEYRLKVIH